MNLKVLFAAALITLPPVADGVAASITNRDSRDHKITVVSGKTGGSRVLKPNEAWSDVCTTGCIIRLNDSETETYELEGSDAVSIEDGFIYYDREQGAPVLEPSVPGR